MTYREKYKGSCKITLGELLELAKAAEQMAEGNMDMTLFYSPDMRGMVDTIWWDIDYAEENPDD